MGHFDKLIEQLESQLDLEATRPIDKAVVETGRMVYDWRRAANLSQMELAKAIGTKQESISRIERGLSKRGPQLATLSAIANACGQRLIISGGPAHQVLADEQNSSDTAWGTCLRRPNRDAEQQWRTSKLEVGDRVELDYGIQPYIPWPSSTISLSHEKVKRLWGQARDKIVDQGHPGQIAKWTTEFSWSSMPKKHAMYSDPRIKMSLRSDIRKLKRSMKTKP